MKSPTIGNQGLMFQNGRYWTINGQWTSFNARRKPSVSVANFEHLLNCLDVDTRISES